MNLLNRLGLKWAIVGALLAAASMFAADKPKAEKPVFLYSRRFSAPGENRYLPDGAYKEAIKQLGADFKVITHELPLTKETLAGVKVVMIVNPSEKAVGTNAPPRHIAREDVYALAQFVERGGGLIFMSNQVEGHNLETEAANKLLAVFGLQTTNLMTDAKKLVLPPKTPIIGGLRWAYYTGNLIQILPADYTKPLGLVVNDLSQKPEKGPRDQAGILLATSELMKGRVVAVTDSGWIADWAFNEEGVGGVAIKGQDNREIFRRLTRWAAHLSPTDAPAK